MFDIGIWLMAARPRTLWLSISPVVIASALAFFDGAFHFLSALGCLFMAIFIQVGTNFTNDYYDYFRGADTKERKGPLRAVQAELVKPQAMFRAIVFVFLMALTIGGMLMWRGGWPMMALCVASILSGYFYTAGPYPLGYSGLADLFVLIFFGPVAVMGTYYVQALSIPSYVFIAGLAPGLFSVAVLTVNNLRDIECDAKCGKRTLAVRFGKLFAKWEYLISLTLAGAVPIVLNVYYHFSLYTMLTLLVLPMALPLLKVVWRDGDGDALNEALVGTAKLLTVYTVLFSVGIFI